MTDFRMVVEFAGPQVSFQDPGRAGFMRFGVPASGPMDRRSAAIAVAALGLAPDHPVVEVSRGGLRLVCDRGSVTYAIAGGGFIVETEGQKRSSWHVATLSAGQTLTVRPGPWGSWTYIALAADLPLDHWLNSAATLGNGNFGGGSLKTGQVISGSTLAAGAQGRALACPVWARQRHELRCVLGPQDRFFAPDVVATFLTAPFSVTDAGDRMGVRLKGPPIPPVAALSIPSEPILKGSVQVSGDGVPTLLMADHQTTGGYPKIATVISCDLDGFAQCRPRDQIAFRAVSAEQALQATRAEAHRVSDHLSRVRAAATGF